MPLPPRALYAVTEHHRRLQEQSGTPGQPWPPEGYAIGTRNGTPLEPRNLTRMWNGQVHLEARRIALGHLDDELS